MNQATELRVFIQAGSAHILEPTHFPTKKRLSRSPATDRYRSSRFEIVVDSVAGNTASYHTSPQLSTTIELFPIEHNLEFAFTWLSLFIELVTKIDDNLTKARHAASLRIEKRLS